MIKYRGAHLIRTGFLGVVIIVLAIAVGLQPERIVQWAAAVRYQAAFSEAGGLMAGNSVKISGVKVGTVSAVELDDDGDALVSFAVKGAVRLGSDSTAHIRTGSILGERTLTLESSGAGYLRPLDIIPVSRTSSPYSLTEAIGDLTTNTAGTDTASLNQSLDTLSQTIDQVAPQLGPMFSGLTRLSQTINRRNENLAALLGKASRVTDVLSDRSQQINVLILNANDLIGVLAARRQAIVNLLASTSQLAKQVKLLIAENEKQLAPTLERINRVTAMLEKHRDTIAKALPGLSKYQITLGETVSSGASYTALIPNLALPAAIQPFFDYAFGFRRGVDGGQPPDNTGPRAELPIPYNGIPMGPH